MGKLFRILQYVILLSGFHPRLLFAQNHSLKDTSMVMDYLVIADTHLDQDRIDSATHYCLKAGQLARALKYKKGIADYISYYIPVLNRQGKYNEALAIALESLEICQTIGNNSLTAQAYNNLGNQYQYLGDLKSAATHYLNSLIFSEGTDTPQRRQRYNNNLASVFLQLEDKNKSYYYAEKSYQMAMQNQDSLGIASSLVNLALSEALNEKYDDAIGHLDQVLKLGQALKDDSYVLDALINKADVQSQKKNYHTSLQLYQRSVQVLKNYPVPDYELYVYWGLAQNHFHLRQYKEANDYLLKSIAVGKAINALQELRKIYLLGSEINEKMNQNAAALDFRKQYEVLNDSLIGIETRQEIHKLEIEYQTSLKEKAIADQQLIIANNNLEIQKKDKFIFLSSTIAIFLLSAIVNFILIYRNKQRTHAEKLKLLQKRNELQVLNAMIEGEEKERSRLAKELHDGVGGILSASKMHLSIIRDEEQMGPRLALLENIVSLLDQASQEIRTIAHNLSPNILLMYELDVAISNFCQRISNTGLNVEYYFLGEMPKLNNRFKLVVYRAVQELLNNVIKHAKADHVLVQLSQHDNILSLTVEDSGIGFSKNVSKGIGLVNLREKIKDLNGQLTIDSEPAKGTTVHLEFDITAFKENPVFEPSSVES